VSRRARSRAAGSWSRTRRRYSRRERRGASTSSRPVVSTQRSPRGCSRPCCLSGPLGDWDSSRADCASGGGTPAAGEPVEPDSYTRTHSTALLWYCAALSAWSGRPVASGPACELAGKSTSKRRAIANSNFEAKSCLAAAEELLVGAGRRGDWRTAERDAACMRCLHDCSTRACKLIDALGVLKAALFCVCESHAAS
jgi:hypothetical protein